MIFNFLHEQSFLYSTKKTVYIEKKHKTLFFVGLKKHTQKIRKLEIQKTRDEKNPKKAIKTSHLFFPQ